MEKNAKLESLGAVFASVVSPLAYVARSAQVGEGAVIMHHALVAGGAAIGRNCIINHKALVEHDARIRTSPASWSSSTGIGPRIAFYPGAGL